MFFNFADKVLFPVGTLENHGIVGVVFFLQWVLIESSLLITNTGMKLIDIRVQEMNVTFQLC